MKILRLILAALAIPIGVAGLILPVLPGWLFLGVAALLIFPETRPAQKILAKIERRFPSTGRALRKLMG